MSAEMHYLRRGYTPAYRTTEINGLDTISVWTPTSSTRLTLTGISISSNLGGTIALYWGNLAGTKVAEWFVAGSASINPTLGPIEGTMYDRSLFAKVSASASDAWHVNLTGFEIP